MLNNITNFFNLIKTGKVKTQLDATDLLPIGTRDLRFSGQYQPTMIKYGDFISGLVGGSNGQVLFNDNDTIAGASTFYWDKVNNRVGIGTSTPANTLDINGTARVSGNTLLDSGIIATSSGTTRLQSSLNFFSHQRLASSGAFGFDIRNSAATQCALWTYDAGSGNINFGGSTSAGALLLSTNNAERLRIFQTTGNVAINTTTDDGFRLDVNGTARVQGRTDITPTIATTNHLLKLSDNTNGTARMGYSSNANIGFFIGSNNALTIGKVSLDNSNPLTNAAQIVLNKNGNPSLELFTYSTNVGIAFSDQNNGTIRMNFPSSNETAITTISSHNFSIGVASGVGSLTSTTMKFFQSTGNVAIGTTTDAGYKLDVNGTARVSGNLTFGFNTTYITTSSTGGGINAGINTFFNNGAIWIDDTSVRALDITYNNGIKIANTTRYPLSLGTSAKAVASAQLEMVSTTQGFLPPRMTQTQRNAIASPAIGLEIYQTDATEGKYIYKSSGWTYIG